MYYCYAHCSAYKTQITGIKRHWSQVLLHYENTNFRQTLAVSELWQNAKARKQGTRASLSLSGFKSHKGEDYVKCGPCSLDFSIAAGGKNDISKHASSEKHKKNVLAADNSMKMSYLS